MFGLFYKDGPRLKYLGSVPGNAPVALGAEFHAASVVECLDLPASSTGSEPFLFSAFGEVLGYPVVHEADRFTPDLFGPHFFVVKREVERPLF